MTEFRGSGEFTIPMERGAKTDSANARLDSLPFAQWLRENQFTSPYLEWYANYACRDDYGALARDTSAWAGIHYFASRAPEEKGLLMWPEGNGWIAKRLIERVRPFLRTGTPVYSIVPEKTRVRVLTETAEYLADRVIFAAPAFLAQYVINGAREAAGFVYSPWVTANLTLDRLPAEKGIEAAWDNVIYESPALGYVSATHMSLRSFLDRTVVDVLLVAGGRPARGDAEQAAGAGLGAGGKKRF